MVFSSSGLSSLLATRKIGFLVRRRMRATVSSSSVMPVLASTTKMMASASAQAASACSRMLPAKASSDLPVSMPPVSTSVKSRPFQSASW